MGKIIKKGRYIYFMQFPNGTIKIGISICPEKRADKLQYEYKDGGGKPEIILNRYLPFQCSRCAEYAFVWNYEYSEESSIDYANCLFENLESYLKDKKCAGMNKRNSPMYNSCGAFNKVHSISASV